MTADESTMAEGDEFAGERPAPLDVETVRRLSRLQPWRSAAHILLEWALIVAAAGLCARFFHPALYLLAVLFIGARQHALGILLHDGTHYRLFHNRTLNDWVTELLLASPFLILGLHTYRRNHFPHHRHLNTPADPDWLRKQTPEWEFPQRPGRLARHLIPYALGGGFIKVVVGILRMERRSGARPSAASPSERILGLARAAFTAALGVALWRFAGGRALFLYWIVPLMTWMQLAFQVRSIAEHFAISGRRGVYAQSRTVLAGLLDRAFIASKNVGYHLEHHLYPSVPFYRLPELHRLLMAQAEYRQSAHLTRGYWGVLRECVGAGGERPSP